MYERKLIDYIPPFLTNVKEYKAILVDGEEPEIVSAWRMIDATLNEQFIHDCTEEGVERWEKILGIVPKATFTLNERKFTILTKMNERVPFTITTLTEQLKSLCGEDGYLITLDNDHYMLKVQVALSAKNNFEDVKVLLQRVVPANLTIVLTLKYNQHKIFANHTHESLNSITHYQLRNEVLTDGS